MVTETVVDFPISASEKGDNKRLVRCESYNSYRHYCICLSVIARIRAGETRPDDRECARSLTANACPSAQMRANEEKAGKALHYMQRDPFKMYEDPQNGIPHTTLKTKHGFAYSVPTSSIKPKAPAPERVVYKVAQQPKPQMAAAARPKIQPVKPKPVVSTGNLYADLVNQMMSEEAKK